MAQQLIPAEFNGTPVSIIEHAGLRWITAEEAGRCLGYAEPNVGQAVRNVYHRHLDEFGEEDSRQIDLISRDVKARLTRIFSATGCMLLAMFANTDLAKEFRQWAKRVLSGQGTAVADAPLPAVVRSPRLEASMGTLANGMDRLADHMGTLAKGMDTVLMQQSITARYIGLLEINQRGTRKVTHEVRNQVLALKEQGMNHTDIARLMRVSRATVIALVNGTYAVDRIPPESETKATAADRLQQWVDREQQKLVQELAAAQGSES